jgi:ribosome-binding protein aMBF1 (putative translation factor)
MEETAMEDRRLKLIMVERGVKNFDLAKYLKVDPAKVSKIVNGWIEPDEATQKKIAKFLGVSVTSIWKGDKDPRVLNEQRKHS